VAPAPVQLLQSLPSPTISFATADPTVLHKTVRKNFQICDFKVCLLTILSSTADQTVLDVDRIQDRSALRASMCCRLSIAYSSMAASRNATVTEEAQLSCSASSNPSFTWLRRGMQQQRWVTAFCAKRWLIPAVFEGCVGGFLAG
jgi:hypothetical protein